MILTFHKSACCKESPMTTKYAQSRLARAALAAAAIVALALAGSAHAAAGARPAAMTSIAMGTEPWIGYGPWWIARDKGFFQKEGLNVNLITFQQDADLNAALASGKTQTANIATHTSIKLILNTHLKITPVLILDDSEGADAMLGSAAIKSLSDLKGKTVAYEYGTTSDLLLHYALMQAKIPVSALHAEHPRCQRRDSARGGPRRRRRDL